MKRRKKGWREDRKMEKIVGWVAEERKEREGVMQNKYYKLGRTGKGRKIIGWFKEEEDRIDQEENWKKDLRRIVFK